MKITTKLSLEYLKRNKRKSIFSIIGIALTMVLFTVIFIILFSYQKYVTNIMRYERNYEAEFKNISYKNAQEIKKDKNIKEISMIHNIGTSEENFSDHTEQGGIGSIMKINISAFDENAIKNNHIELLTGRMPTNTHEIVIGSGIPSEGITGITEEYIENLGKKIEITINGKKEKYEIVGTAKNLPNSVIGFSTIWIIPALTYFDENNFTEDMRVDVSILTNNIHKIYETTNGLAEKLNLYKTEEEKNSNLTYYTRLLYYELVDVQKIQEEQQFLINQEDVNAEEFAGDLRNIVIALISIISVASIIVIYTTFKMTYRERIKELGMLSSIGMDKKQKERLLLKETLILATMGIIIGCVIGSIISFIIIKYLSILANETMLIQGAKIFFNSNVEMYMVFPILPIFAGVFLTYIISIISSLMPMRKINKISPIEAIRHTNEEDIKQKNIKTPKIISKLFKQEGELAYKNIRKDKSRYKTIVISIVVSIVLFISINQLTSIKLFHQYGKTEKEEYASDYVITVEGNCQEKGKDIINKLKEKELINNYAIISNNISFPDKSEIVISMSEDRITEVGKILGQNEKITLSKVGNEFIIYPDIVALSGGAIYRELLEKFGIKELKEDECILINKAFGTKYENKGNITNYSKGEKIVLKELDNRIIKGETVLTAEEKEAQKQTETALNEMLNGLDGNNNNVKNEDMELINNAYELKIIAVENEKIPFFSRYGMVMIVNPNLYKKMTSAENTGLVPLENEKINIYISTDNPTQIDKEIEGIEGVSGTNRKGIFKEMQNSNVIEEIVIYTFIILIALFSCLNIFNTIFSNIILRKKEIAMLKSIGMSNKQINKMLFLEIIFYGLDAIIYGILISLIILYVIYIALIETEIYAFYIPIDNMLLCIAIAYTVIFLSFLCAKGKIRKQNIIDEVRNETM